MKVDLVNFEVCECDKLSEAHKAIIGVSRLGELRHSLYYELSCSAQRDDLDNIIEMLNGTLAEINDQIDEVIDCAVCYLGNKN